MTKQDVYDIITILDPLFESIGKEVRNELTFRFENEDMDNLPYDSPNLFMDYDENEVEIPVESFPDNLIIEFYVNESDDFSADSHRIIAKLEKSIQEKKFLIHVFQYLNQEFKINNFSYTDGQVEITIQDTEGEVQEGVNLKKFNQF